MFGLASGYPDIVPLLIGGAVGGALPDIDMPGSAIEKMGSKSTSLAGKVVSRFGGSRGGAFKRLSQYIGFAFDRFVFAPVAFIWRFLAEHVFGKIYRFLYTLGGKNGGKSLGERLHWVDDSQPWQHRGGMTHSFLFMITSLILVLPFAILFNNWSLVIGCEFGILSHLVTDAMCRSGVKFFFPWSPKVGFVGTSGQGRGQDVRILPPSFQVSTGKDRITDNDLYHMPEDKAKTERHLRFLEKFWQKFFQILAIIIVALLICFATANHAGALYEPNNIFNFGGMKTQNNQEQVQSAHNNNDNNNVGSDPAQQEISSSQAGTDEQQSNDASGGDIQQVTESKQVNIAEEGSNKNGVVPHMSPGNIKSMTSVPETKGPTSLTNGDVDISILPKGITKMPDESLHVVGVGPVSKETLDDPKWTFTEDEKRMLLSIAAAQRLDGIPNSVTEAMSGIKQNVADGYNNAKETVNELNEFNNNGFDGSNASGGNLGNVENLDDKYTYGFLGITPFTQTE